MKKSQGGFSIVVVALVILIIGVVGFVGWKVYYSSHEKKTVDTQAAVKQTNTNSTKQAQPATTPELKEFCSEVEKACFKYPTDWKLTVVTKYDNNPDTQNVESIKLTSPNNTVISWSTPVQGLGGGCDLDATNEITVDSIKTNPQDSKLQILKIHKGEDVNNNIAIGYFKPDEPVKPLKVGKTGQCIVYFTYVKGTPGTAPTVMFYTNSYNQKDEAATYQIFESLTYK